MVKKVRKPVKLLKLDLACGAACKEGFEGVDIVKCPGVVHVVDLFQFPWPFRNESVEEINCSHFVEHIPMKEVDDPTTGTKDMFFAFFDEMYRVLVPGGRAVILCPWYASVRAWQDPTHRRAISDVTFAYLNKTWREQVDLSHYNVDCDFDYTPSYVVQQSFAVRHEEQRAFAMNHYMNAIMDISVVLVKRGSNGR